MKFRKGIIALTLLSSLLMNFSAYAEEIQSDEEGYSIKSTVLRKVKHVYEDFEDYTGGSNNLSIYLALNNAKATKGESELMDGTSICMDFTDVDFEKTAKAEPFLYYTYPTSEDFSWKAEACFEGKVPSGGFVVVAKSSTGSNVYLQNVNFSGGDLVINNLKSEGKRITLEQNRKYTFEYFIDMSNKTFDFYLDNELVAENYKLQSDFQTISQLRLITSGDAENHGNVYLDNFTIYKFTEAENISPELFWELENEINLNEVSEICISATDADGDIERVELYIDDELFGTQNGAFANFDISDLKKGEYMVKAVAYDNEGASSEIEKIVNFVKNEIEAITVTTNLSEDSYDISEIKKVIINTSGNTSEIEKVKMYIDKEEVLTSSKTEISCDFIPTGRHEIKFVVFDADMNKGSWKKELLFTENIDDIWYENDFSTYAGGNNVTGLTINVTNGLSYNGLSETADEKYGNSMYFNINGENVTAETMDVGVWYNANTSQNLKWKVSMCFDEIPENVHFQTVGPNKTGMNVYMSNIIIKNGVITAGGENVGSVESGRFYDFSYQIDMENQKYSFVMNGETLVSGKEFTGEIDKITTLRLVTSYKKKSKTGFFIDNVSVSGDMMMPYIISSEKVGEDSICFEMTDAESLELSDVCVKADGGACEISEFLKEGNRIFLKMKNSLEKDTEYVVYAEPSVMKSGVKEYGRTSSSAFKTENGEFGVSDVSFRTEYDTLVAEAKLYNNSETLKTALIVLNIYKENKIIDSVVKSISLKCGEESSFELIGEGYDNSTVCKVFFLNSWKERSAFSNRLFKY